MSTKVLMTIVFAFFFAPLGVAVMIDNSNKLRNEDNAFAKDCNDRGGVAKFKYSVRQCIGAKPKEQTNVG